MDSKVPWVPNLLLSLSLPAFGSSHALPTYSVGWLPIQAQNLYSLTPTCLISHHSLHPILYSSHTELISIPPNTPRLGLRAFARAVASASNSLPFDCAYPTSETKSKEHPLCRFPSEFLLNTIHAPGTTLITMCYKFTFCQFLSSSGTGGCMTHTSSFCKKYSGTRSSTNQPTNTSEWTRVWGSIITYKGLPHPASNRAADGTYPSTSGPEIVPCRFQWSWEALNYSTDQQMLDLLYPPMYLGLS